VFAFDPSPVTGFLLVDEGLRDQNAANVEIDRIYQSGEFLAWIRPGVQQFPWNSSRCVRTVLFDVNRGYNPFKLHYINPLARKIVQYSYERNEPQPFSAPALTRCGAYAPRDDKDDYDAPPPDHGPGIASRGGPGAAVTPPNRDRVVTASFRTDSYEMATLPQPDLDRSVTQSARAKAPRGVRTVRSYEADKAPQWQWQVSAASYRER
jgi:hypothetical protein